MPLFSVIPTDATPCKICGGKSGLFGVVDFHKSCAEHYNVKFSLSGVPVYYRRCETCHFVFTDMFDSWSKEEFELHIYNKDYELTDPRYKHDRPVQNAEFINKVFGSYIPQIKLLDYGGGDGKLVALLKQNGFNAELFDPFFQDDKSRPAVKANIVTCFEVIEHSPKPQAFLDDLLSFFDEQCIFLFSTCVQPADFDTLGLNWWYVGPRNGHVSIYSREALARLFNSRGLAVASINDNLHMACRNPPPFAVNIFKAGQMITKAA